MKYTLVNPKAVMTKQVVGIRALLETALIWTGKYDNCELEDLVVIAETKEIFVLELSLRKLGE